MKVLHINSYYSVSNFYKNLYKQQVLNGADIDVFTPVPSYYKENGFDFGPYTTISANYHKFDRFFFHLKHFKIYKDIASKYNLENYNIIHAHSLFSNGYIAMKIKKKYKIPYIVAVRNTDVNTFFKKMIHLRKMGVNILEEADTIIFLSKSYRELVIKRYIPTYLKEEIYKKSVVIPNGIDDFWFNNKTVMKKVTKKEIKLLYVGEINKNKNILTTIKAVEILRKRGFNTILTVVGKVSDQEIYNSFINKTFVKYIKPVTKEELIEIYRDNDIFVMPSHKETFGLVYAEAMSQGLPVIYSEGQGFDGQFDEGRVGYKVNSSSAEEIQEKVLKIFERFQDISLNCSVLVERFKWESIEKDYQSIYKKLL